MHCALRQRTSVQDRDMYARRTCKTLSTESSFFTFRINRASSTVIRCSLVSLSVADPVVAFPTPAASPPAAPCGRYFASKSACQHNPHILYTPAARAVISRTRCSLLPGGVERLSKDFCASNSDLHDGLWRRLSGTSTRLVSLAWKCTRVDIRTIAPNPTRDDGDSIGQRL